MFSWIKDRLSEPSTWRGLIGLLTAAGITLSPDQADNIIAAGIAIMGALGAFTADKKPK